MQKKRHLLHQQVPIERYRYSVVGMWDVLLKMGALIPYYSSEMVGSSNNVIKSFGVPTTWAG